MSGFRLLLSGPADPYMNMALDEAVSTAVRAGKSPPTLRLYTWKEAAVTIGYFQQIEKVRLHFLSLPIVRRITGGGAVLHGTDLTYSIACPGDHTLARGGVMGSYRAIGQALLLGIRELGEDAGFVPPRLAPPHQRRGEQSPLCFEAPSAYEITVGGRKIIGSAQKRWLDGFLQQGSLLLDVLSEGVRRTITLPEALRAITRGFETSLGQRLIEEKLTPDEREASLLLAQRYRSGEWNNQR